MYVQSVNPLFGLPKIEYKSSHFDSSKIDHKSFVETQIILQQSQSQPQIQVHPIMANPPTIMDIIIAARYAPSRLPRKLNSLPAGDYQKYLPKYTGEGEVTIEEHLAAFYSFAYNHNVENQDLWMRLLVQSLDDEPRKWFNGFSLNSIIGIEVLDDVFLKCWGDKKDYLYYITEFGFTKRKKGELVSNFNKIFNKMYHNIPDEINPSEIFAKITYEKSFESEFPLLLIGRRSTSLTSI